MLLLSTCGISLMFAWVVFVCQMGLKVELVWLSSFFLLLGGGPQVFNAMIFAAVSDSLGDAERLDDRLTKRKEEPKLTMNSTQYLYLLHAGPHVNRLLTPRIAAALMSVALLWPFFWSFAIFGGCVLLVTIFYQEMTFRGPDITKRGYGQLRRDSTDEQQAAFLRSPQRDSEHDDSSESEHSGDPNSAYQKNPSRRNTCFALQSSWWREQRTLLLRLFGSRTAAFCLACFLFKRIAFTSEGFIFQYTSEKFGWKLRETTWLRISAAIGAIVTTMIICPTLSTVCKRKGFNTHKLDLWIIRVCLIVLCAAFMMAFEAPSAAWLFPAMLGMGLGEGTEPALQGLITFITEPSDYSQLFGVLALVDSVAGLIGGPVSASLMTVGRSQDSDSNGLNFLSSAVSITVSTMRAQSSLC